MVVALFLLAFLSWNCRVGLCHHFSDDVLLSSSEGRTTCPGGKQSCADGYTCCEMKEVGAFSCCPIRDAVCCEDKIHCCPKGSTCNTKSGGCDKMSIATMSLEEQPIKLDRSPSVNGSSIICPDGAYQCPDHSTCCPLGDADQYGCCPLENATCCPDKQHCCPHGYKCNEAGMCVLSP